MAQSAASQPDGPARSAARRSRRTSPRAVADEPRREEIVLHGHRVCYRIAGTGPAILLVHGITGSSEQWLPAMRLLAGRHTVIAPDLLGHGQSAKPAGDYSLGAFASGLRDLTLALGIERSTVVGHSLGGGVAMQYAYQFPERTERLVLVSSGGLGREVNLILRAATLPGSELVLPLLAGARLLGLGRALGAALDRIGLRPGLDLLEMARGHSSLGDAGTRSAFLHTLRAVVEPGGQSVSAVDRLYLASEMPSLIVWGRRDPLIPVHHAGVAHRAMPDSRLEVFDEAGHFPQLQDPLRFARVLEEFVESTEPATVDLQRIRDRLLAEQPAIATEGATEAS